MRRPELTVGRSGFREGTEMGNASSVTEGVEDSQQMEGSQDLMGQSPLHSPGRAAQSPLLFTPQIPMAPLPRSGEMHLPSDVPFSTSVEPEFTYEQGIPTMITWTHGGKDVAVEGSWDNWKMKKPLQKSGKDFTIMKVLPSGFYQYRFFVDGVCRHAPDLPWIHDEMGNVCNILDLQDFVPEDVGSIAGFEPPKSPDSSYNSWPLVSDDYAKEPPLAPPQLYPTLLNAPPPASDVPCVLTRPQHVVLDHLYIQKAKSNQPVVALGATSRFKAKYVTVVLFKSLRR